MLKENEFKVIAGAGGGGDEEKRVPVEDSDSLFSKAYAQVLDLISEGEIVGLTNGLKSIYLDETQVETLSGRVNFKSVTYDERKGTQSQSYISGYEDVTNEIVVSQKIEYGAPVIKTITDTNVNAVRIRISVPTLQKIDSSNGDVHGSTVYYKVYAQINGGGYYEQFTRAFSGKCSSKFERNHVIGFSAGQLPPYDIKIERLTPDGGAFVTDAIYWESYTEIVHAKQRYPNSALIGLTFDSGQFRSVPQRAYDMKGLKIKIPSNASVRSDGSLTFSGSWNGTFQVAWTTCPAWIYYDLIINTRYGLGSYVSESQIDKWTLYSISVYANALVSNGFGSTEPRFSCSLYLQSQEEAYNVLKKLASVFRGMTYWGGGQIIPTQDGPTDVSAIFSQANVLDGLFNYQSSASKARHTVCIVSWNDPSDFYRQKFEYVEDTVGIARLGVITTQIEGVGCTSRGQAHRIGKWLLYTEQNETETVSFKTGLDGATLYPSQVIKIADPMRAGARMGGRIVSATTTTVTIDSSLVASNTWSIACLLSDGTIEEKSIVSQTGATITVAAAFSSVPQSGSVWVLKSPTLEPQIFRIVGVVEYESGLFDVTALKHEPNKFEYIENNLVLQERNYSVLSAVPEAPINLTLTESLYESQSEVKVKLQFSWNSVSGAVSYLVQYKRDSGNFLFLPETSSNNIDILDVQEGSYTAQVVALSSLGKRSDVSEITYRVIGKTAPPSNVQNFSMIPMSNLASLSWDKATDLDVLIGGYIRVRHTPKITGQKWIDAVDIVPALSGNTTSVTTPLLAGTYMAKFVDSSGISSVAETIIVTTIPTPLALNVIQTITESPTFAGTKTNCYYYSSLGGLALFDGTLVDDLGFIDQVGNFDFPSNIPTTGTYYFTNTLDLGNVYTSGISIYLDVEALDISSFIDVRTNNVDDWTDIDGLAVDDVNARLYLRTTNDDPSGSPTWSNWRPFYVAAYTARGFQWKLVMESNSINHNIIVKNLSVTVDMPDRVVQENNLTSGVGTYTVTFAEPFKVTPAIGVTAKNLASGDYSVIASESATGFQVTFKNSSNTTISRNFDYIAKGYGRKTA